MSKNIITKKFLYQRMINHQSSTLLQLIVCFKPHKQKIESHYTSVRLFLQTKSRDNKIYEHFYNIFVLSSSESWYKFFFFLIEILTFYFDLWWIDSSIFEKM